MDVVYPRDLIGRVVLRLPSPALRAASPARGRGEMTPLSRNVPPLPLAGEGWGEGNLAPTPHRANPM